MTPNEKSVEQTVKELFSTFCDDSECHHDHAKHNSIYDLEDKVTALLLSEREKVKRLTAACQRVVNDSAQDEIEDPVGHSKRWREGFERIHKNAVEQCAKALSPATEEGKA